MPGTTPTGKTTTTTAAVAGNWWDKLGTPQYGGEMVIRLPRDIVYFDPYNGSTSITSAWMERLTGDNWTLDPSVFGYNIDFHPSEYLKGLLAESWEFTDPSTYVVHIRKGIKWQDIPPVSGREFTADDVVWDYDRMYGLGNGFTKPSPFTSSAATFKDLISLTATDKYTAVFKWKVSNPEYITETLQSSSVDNCIVPHEAVEKWGDLTDWHHQIGTGPFILQDFVSGSSATLAKNPNYWGYDERHPQNRIPYIDTLRVLIIANDATVLAGLRTGKIDAMDGITYQSAQSIQKTNPEILQVLVPSSSSRSIDPRNDVKPFNDLRVRKALQMAIDLPTIAKTIYSGTTESYPCALTSFYEKGWGFPYTAWPQDLKDEYTYNPTAAKKLLADAGYPSGLKTNIVADNTSDLDLLQTVKSYFSDIGVDMEIRTMDSPAWLTFVRVSHKNDQLAVSPNGILGVSFEPIRQLMRYQTGYPVNYNMVSDPIFDAFYPKALAATSVDQVKQVLKDANEYVARQHFGISLLTPNLFGLYQPWLKGYNGQTNAISGGSGPILMGFYLSRFWIDQNLKKSLGH